MQNKNTQLSKYKAFNVTAGRRFSQFLLEQVVSVLVWEVKIATQFLTRRQTKSSAWSQTKPQGGFKNLKMSKLKKVVNLLLRFQWLNWLLYCCFHYWFKTKRVWTEINEKVQKTKNQRDYTKIHNVKVTKSGQSTSSNPVFKLTLKSFIWKKWFLKPVEIKTEFVDFVNHGCEVDILVEIVFCVVCATSGQKW